MRCLPLPALVLVVASVAGLVPNAIGCPKCRVAAAELEEPTTGGIDSATQPGGADSGPFKGLSLAIGADFPTAYYYRGYLQQDRGFIAQPFFTISADFKPNPDLSIQPYVGWMNTFFGSDNADLPAAHSGGVGRSVRSRVTEVPAVPPATEPTFVIDLVPTGGDGKGWYESEVMLGTTIVYRDLFVDMTYRVHFFPDDVHDTMQEIGAKVSYDLAGLWDRQTPSNQRRFSLRPAYTVYLETSDQNGGEETFVEVALEPAWRFKLFNQRAAVATPIALSGSPDGYYVTDTGEDDDLGYLSASVKGSIALPIPDRYGSWFLNGSVTYLHLLSSGLQESNRGDRDDLYASIGIGVSF